MRIDLQDPSAADAPPPWLTYVTRADNDFAWLRLLIVNPLNGTLCISIEEPVEVEGLQPGPGASDLPTARP